MTCQFTVEQSLGRNIQRLRRAKGYTQQQLAEMVGISTNYLSDIERGKNSARIDKLVAVINALGCSADDIFEDVIDHAPDIDISAKAEQLSPQQAAVVSAVIDALRR